MLWQLRFVMAEIAVFINQPIRRRSGLIDNEDKLWKFRHLLDGPVTGGYEKINTTIGAQTVCLAYSFLVSVHAWWSRSMKRSMLMMKKWLCLKVVNVLKPPFKCIEKEPLVLMAEKLVGCGCN